MTETPVPSDPRREPVNDTAQVASSLDGTPEAAPSSGTTPETGDLVVDAALADLAAVDASDLDAVLAAGESVHATLTSRLSDLGS